jgi:AraC-like DNA-binding protein
MSHIARILVAGARGEEGLCAWRDVLRGVFHVVVPAEAAAFVGGEVAVWRVGEMVAARLAGRWVGLERRLDEAGIAGSDDFAVWLVRDGVIDVQVGNGLAAETVGAGGVFFLDMVQPAGLRFATAGNQEAGADVTSSLVVWVRRIRLLAALREAQVDDAMLHGLVLRGAVAAVVATVLAGLVEGAAGADEGDSHLGGAVVDLIARAVAPRLRARPAAASGVAPGDHHARGSLATICRYIHAHLAAADLDADLLAVRFGLSRASLYRLFQPLGGVAGYIVEQRLSEAFRQLRAAEFANHRIGQISFRLGFKNVSNFSRAFRGKFGMSPSDAKRVGCLGAAPPAGAVAGETLGCWLARAA